MAEKLVPALIHAHSDLRIEKVVVRSNGGRHRQVIWLVQGEGKRHRPRNASTSAFLGAVNFVRRLLLYSAIGCIDAHRCTQMRKLGKVAQTMS